MRLHLFAFFIVFHTTSEEQFHPEKNESDGFHVSNYSDECLKFWFTPNSVRHVKIRTRYVTSELDNGRSQTLLRGSVKFSNFEKLFWSCDSA